MFTESLLLLSFDELKNLLLRELTISHIAIVYVLMYVMYKALGRYIYFKPQEHASKINRTFLTLSLIIVLFHVANNLTNYLPFPPEYSWFYILCWIIIIVAPFSIIIHRIIWKYDRYGISSRNWHYEYLKIQRDYYKTSVSKSEEKGNISYTWEEEGVQSTGANIHSDAFLNIFALIVFISVSGYWTCISAESYGYLSYVFSALISFTIAGMFLDHSLFSWIKYLELKYNRRNKK